MEERLDKLLIQLNLMDSRVQAEKFIQNIGVLVNGKLINKPGKKVPVNSLIKLFQSSEEISTPTAYSLKNTFDKWKLNLGGKSVLDVFPKDDSFYQVVNKQSLNSYYVVSSIGDYVFGEIPQVTDLSKRTIRELTSIFTSSTIDFVNIHSTDQSLFQTLPFILPVLKSEGELIVLLKPEIEASKEDTKPNGSLKDYGMLPRIMDDVKNNLSKIGLTLIDKKISEVIGKDGFTEYYLRLRKI